MSISFRSGHAALNFSTLNSQLACVSRLTVNTRGMRMPVSHSFILFNSQLVCVYEPTDCQHQGDEDGGFAFIYTFPFNSQLVCVSRLTVNTMGMRMQG